MSRITAPIRTIRASTASSSIATTTSRICARRWSGTAWPDAGPIGTRSTMSGTACRARRCIALYAEADALINLCGATRLREEHMRVPGADHDRYRSGLRADQIRQAEPGGARLSRRAHAFLHLWRQSRHRACPMPLCGVPWRPTRPPVDLDLWPFAADSADCGKKRCFTTIATWENKGKNIEFEGANYLWSKHVNFVRFLDVPRHRPESCFTMAMLPPDDGGAPRGRGQRLAPRRSAPGLGRYGRPIAISSPARAASSPSPRTSMSGRTAAGSAIAPCATWRAAVRS